MQVKVKQVEKKEQNLLNKDVYINSMKRLGLSFGKDKFETKEQIMDYCKKNAGLLGVIVEFNDEEKWSESDQRFYY